MGAFLACYMGSFEVRTQDWPISSLANTPIGPIVEGVDGVFPLEGLWESTLPSCDRQEVEALKF